MQLHSFYASYQSPALSDTLPTKIQLNVTSYSHDSVCWIYPWGYSHAKPSAHILFFCSQPIIISLEKLSSVQIDLVELVLSRCKSSLITVYVIQGHIHPHPLDHNHCPPHPYWRMTLPGSGTCIFPYFLNVEALYCTVSRSIQSSRLKLLMGEFIGTYTA